MTPRQIKISKFISLVLRHQPEQIGLQLNAQGWVSVNELLVKAQQHNFNLGRAELEAVVADNDKQRFSFNHDKTQIRANQGHSVSVELGYTPIEPPAILYHGTAAQFLPAILKQGLNKGKRHHVHLSADINTASKVGRRHGKLVLLEVNSAAMYTAGYVFYLSENGVWLTAHVPSQYLVRKLTFE